MSRFLLPAAWIADPKQNMFESISAGRTSGVATVRSLLLDEGHKEPLHRHHLLGMNDFYTQCTDIGIGFARHPRSKYKTYVCVLIARRK